MPLIHDMACCRSLKIDQGVFRPFLQGCGRAGNEVHAMAMYAKVRRMRLRDGLSISEIARRTLVSRDQEAARVRVSLGRGLKHDTCAPSHTMTSGSPIPTPAMRSPMS
jgi:hypothetical protein